MLKPKICDHMRSGQAGPWFGRYDGPKPLIEALANDLHVVLPLAELERAGGDRVAITLRAHLLDGLRRREYRVLVSDELLDLGNYASASGHETLTSGGKPGIPGVAVPHWRGRWPLAFA